MTLIVADSGPILSYARAGQFPLLVRVIPAVLIPDAVYEEIVVAGAGRPGSQEVASGTWATRQAVTNPSSFEGLSPILDPGEREALALARELSLPVLLDDERGRREARRLSLPYLTSLLVLTQAKDLGFLDQVKPTLDLPTRG